jgi:CRP-like cAMP-binding protein
MKFYQV